MQCNPSKITHVNTKICREGRARRQQRKRAVDSALALRQLFTVNRDVLERVDSFQYLGHIMAQDDDDHRVIQRQLRKARGEWAQVSQVL